MSKIFRMIVGATLVMAAFGCQQGGLDFKIRFDEIRGLKAGDGIIFEANRIGAVQNVVYTRDGDYLVETTVEPNFANAATRDSQFYIVDDPQAAGKKVIEIVQEKSGGTVLRDGEIVAGSVKSTILKQFFGSLQKEAERYQGQMDSDLKKLKESFRQGSLELEAGLERVLAELSSQFSDLAAEMEKVPDSEELKALEETLNRLSRELEHAHGAVRDKIQNELLPEIQERLDRLRENLEQYNRQQEIEPLDRRIEEMRKA